MTPPYPQQYPPQYPPPAGGRLVVSSSYFPLAFLLALTGPKIEINGQPIRAKWGDWPIDLPAGNYLVRVSTRYLGDFGPAQLGVTVYPGQQVTVFYRAPAVIGVGGSIGFQPQPTRGVGLSIAIAVLPLVLVLLMVVLTL